MPPDDAQLLDELIAKLREMEEHLAMAEIEASSQTLLQGRIRHLYILAHYVRMRLEVMADPGGVPPKPSDLLQRKPG